MQTFSLLMVNVINWAVRTGHDISRDIGRAISREIGRQLGRRVPLL